MALPLRFDTLFPMPEQIEALKRYRHDKCAGPIRILVEFLEGGRPHSDKVERAWAIAQDRFQKIRDRFAHEESHPATIAFVGFIGTARGAIDGVTGTGAQALRLLEQVDRFLSDPEAPGGPTRVGEWAGASGERVVAWKVSNPARCACGSAPRPGQRICPVCAYDFEAGVTLVRPVGPAGRLPQAPMRSSILMGSLHRGYLLLAPPARSDREAAIGILSPILARPARDVAKRLESPWKILPGCHLSVLDRAAKALEQLGFAVRGSRLEGAAPPASVVETTEACLLRLGIDTGEVLLEWARDGIEKRPVDDPGPGGGETMADLERMERDMFFDMADWLGFTADQARRIEAEALEAPEGARNDPPRPVQVFHCDCGHRREVSGIDRPAPSPCPRCGRPPGPNSLWRRSLLPSARQQARLEFLGRARVVSPTDGGQPVTRRGRRSRRGAPAPEQPAGDSWAEQLIFAGMVVIGIVLYRLLKD